MRFAFLTHDAEHITHDALDLLFSLFPLFDLDLDYLPAVVITAYRADPVGMPQTFTLGAGDKIARRNFPVSTALSAARLRVSFFR